MHIADTYFGIHKIENAKKTLKRAIFLPIRTSTLYKYKE